jgi:cyclic 2,3-diphosphoglycerate synthetase
VALIDGEHYPPVVAAALSGLAGRFDIAAALFLGGGEKLREGSAEYGVPVVRVAEADDAAPDGAGSGAGATPAADGRRYAALRSALDSVLADTGAQAVVDLSDEPVLGYRARFQLISVALARGARYVGADFEFFPQPLERLSSKPSLAVIGTGKRVGKTAVSGYLARRLAVRCGGPAAVVVVAMGRGGPAEPEVVRGAEELGAAELLGASRSGLHAASDCYEDAVLAGVTVVGCRRCGGGMGGAAVASNVRDAIGLVEGLPGAMVVWEGSGAVIPPVRADAVACVAGAGQPADDIVGYLGTYRMLISDLVVLTMCEPPFADGARVERLRRAVADVRPEAEVVTTVFRPRPAGDIGGRRVAYFTTAGPEALPTMTRHLEEVHGAEVVVASGDLARRAELRAAVEKGLREAEVFLTEIKAAAIDVVAEAADAAGLPLVFCDNEPVSEGGEALDASVERLAALAHRRFTEDAA